MPGVRIPYRPQQIKQSKGGGIITTIKLQPDIAKKIIENILKGWKTLERKDQEKSLNSALKIASELPDNDLDKQKYIKMVTDIKRTHRGFAI